MSASLPPVLGTNSANGAVQTPAKASKTIQGFPTVGGSLGAQDSGVSIVTSQIVPGKLTEGVLFNAPQPNIQDYALGKNLAIPNSRGFLVSDPVWRSQVRDIKSTWASWNDNYGFRFSYNPETVQEQYTMDMKSDPILAVRSAAQKAYPVGLDTGVTMSLNLTLYRGEDLNLLAGSDYEKYYNGITSEQRDNILANGTQADIEHLFRLCNGSPIETWRGTTSDWGMLLPSIVVVSLSDYTGTRRIRARITTVSWTHKLFAPGMVPIHTEMTIELARMSDGYYQAGKDVGTSADPGTGGSGVQSGTTDTTSGSNTDTANSASGRLNLGVDLGTGVGTPMRTKRTGRTPAQAVAWLNKHLGMGGVFNQCLRLADDAYNPTGGRLPRAIDQWNRAKKAGYAHPGDRNPPPGAQVFWWSSNPARHIATAVGGGYIIGNVGDTVQKKKFSFYNGYGPYLGWAEPYYGG